MSESERRQRAGSVREYNSSEGANEWEITSEGETASERETNQ